MNCDLSYIDMFGIGVGLKYLNKEKFQTRYGALISIFISGMICFQAILVGSELFLKTNPEVIYSERYVASPEQFVIKKDTFNFAFGIEHPQNFTHFIDNQVFTVEAIQYFMIKEYDEASQKYVQNWKNMSLQVNPCKISDFSSRPTTQYFMKLAYDNLFCIDQSSSNIIIEGQYDADIFSFVEIGFKLCDNQPNCKSETEIAEILNNSYVGFYSDDIIVNPKNSQPFSEVGRDFFWNASPSISKNIYMYLRNIYVETDNGLLFEDKSIDHRTGHSYQTESIIFTEGKNFFSIQLRFEKVKESIYNRKYLKINTVLAQIGGVAKALMIIGFIICFPINQLKLHKQISNQLFSYKDNNSDISKGNEQIPNIQSLNQKDSCVYRSQSLSPLVCHYFQKNLSICENKDIIFDMNNEQQTNKNTKNENSNIPSFQSIGYQSNFRKMKQLQMQVKTKNLNQSQMEKKEQNQFADTILTGNQQISKNSKKIKNSSAFQMKSIFQKEDKEIQKQAISLRWYDYIQFYLWPFGSFKIKKKKIQKSVQKIYQHLDMINIVQKLLEIEKIKHLLLDSNQIKLIQFFPKPSFDIEKIEQESTQKKQNDHSNIVSLLDNKLSDKENAKEAYQALKNILKKEELTEVDKKIIEMLDKSIFENIENHLIYIQDLEEQEINQMQDSNLHDNESLKINLDYQIKAQQYRSHSPSKGDIQQCSEKNIQLIEQRVSQIFSDNSMNSDNLSQQNTNTERNNQQKLLISSIPEFKVKTIHSLLN